MTNQEQSIHIIREGLYTLNITRTEVRENRKAIPKLDQIIKQLDTNFAAFSKTIIQQLAATETFIQTYIQLDIMISDLKDAVNRALFYLEQTREKFNQLTLGHISPFVVTSHELTNMLKVIEEQLPNHLFLPKALEMTWYYYKTLTCTTLIENDKFLTIINIPLLEVNK